jgi:hypothetical protein
MCSQHTSIRRLSAWKAGKTLRDFVLKARGPACPRKTQRVPTGLTPWGHWRPDDHLDPARNSPSTKSTTLVSNPTERSGQPPRWCDDAAELSAEASAEVRGDTHRAQRVQEAVAEKYRYAVQLLDLASRAT